MKNKTAFVFYSLAVLSLSVACPETFAIEVSLEEQTVRFQNGIDGYSGTRDAEIREVVPTLNNGRTDLALEVDGDDGGGKVAALLQWNDLTIPENATITAASITITITNPGEPYAFYQMLRDWDESQVTWNEARSGQPWQIAGVNGDADRGDRVGRTNILPTGIYTTELNEAGIAMVQSWIDDPATYNFGVIFADPGSSTDGVDFWSSEHNVASERPQLNISYTVNNIPEPSGIALALLGTIAVAARFRSRQRAV